jgi:phage gpG-like protein
MVNDMGQTALNHFTQSFRDQGFTDETKKAWPGRKRQRDNGRAILVKSGNLRKLRKQNIGKYKARILTNIASREYASVHNNGERSGRGIGFNMPKRQFMGHSKLMERKIKSKINSRIQRIFK